MKAPKSVMFLTTPSRIWPSSNTLTISSRIRARSSSSTARRETTMLRRALLSLMILKGNWWPMNWSKFLTWRMSICEPGRKASTPKRLTTMPPLMRRISRPSTVLPVS